MPRSVARVVRTAFLLSGAAGLILEVVWAKELSYILGNSLYAVSTVVAAFMAGLGLGGFVAARRAGRRERPLLLYAALELLIGLCGVSFHSLFRASGPLFEALYRAIPPGGLFLLARFFCVFALLLIPATLMGMTLPVVVGALTRRKRRADPETALLYGLNTIGAVAGTLGAGFVLIPSLGLARASMIAGGIDLLIAAAVFLVARRGGPGSELRVEAAGSSEPALAPAGWNGRQWLIALLYVVSGSLALVFEVAWFRLLGLALGPSVYAFSAMLGVYLAGMGIGSTAIAPWLRRSRARGLTILLALQGAAGILTLLELQWVNLLPRLQGRLFTAAVPVLGERAFAFSLLLVSACVVFLPCLLLGAVFPAAVRAVQEAGSSASSDPTPELHVGQLYLCGTVGGIVGSLLAGFVLLPRLSLGPTLIAAGIVSLLLAAGYSLLQARSSPNTRFRVAAAAAIAVVLALLAPRPNAALLNLGLYREAYSLTPASRARESREQLLYHREGIQAAVAVYRAPGNATLYISGKPDASLARIDLYTQTLLGHLPAFLARHPRRAGVIGYGSGITAGALLAHPEVERLEILEIERAVIEASPYFETVNGRPLGDARTRLILDDGRVHLSYTRDRYDLIVSEPSNPWMAGIAGLFTVDFYKTVRARLMPGGIFAQWIQSYDISEESFRTILAGLAEAFPHLVLFQSSPSDFIVLASPDPIAVPWETVQSRFRTPAVTESCRRAGIRDPLLLGFFFQGGDPAVRAMVGGIRLRNTDDNAYLEYRLPKELLNLTREDPLERRLTTFAVEHGGGTRVADLTRLFSDLPLDPCLREMALYPNSQQPNPLSTERGPDLWLETREAFLSELQEELRREGKAELAADLEALDDSSFRAREARQRATDELRALAHEMGEAPSGGQDEGATAPRLERFHQRIQAALREAPDLALARLMLAGYFFTVGDSAASRRAYESALEVAEGTIHQESLLGLSQVVLAEGRSGEALSLCREAVDWNPYFPKTHLQLAATYRKLGHPAEAAEAVERGLWFNPGDRLLSSQGRALSRPESPPPR